jgi:hypothetical protein
MSSPGLDLLPDRPHVVRPVLLLQTTLDRHHATKHRLI